MPNGPGMAWLALRVMLRRSGTGALATVVALGAIVLTALALATLAAPGAASAQHARRLALTPHLTMRGGPSSAATLRVLPPYVSSTRRWNEHTIVRTFYARGASTLVAPGVPAMPDEGEYYASSDLRTLIEHDRTVAALFAGKQLVGTISDEGLTQPHELRAIVGISPRAPFLAPVTGFGVSKLQLRRQGIVEDNTRLNITVVMMVIFMTWLPAAAFIVIVTRLSARQRRRRARALRLLGLSRTAVRALQAAQTGLVVIPSAVAGAGAYWWFVHHITRIPGTDLGYFPADADPGWGWFVGVVAGLTLVMSLSSALSLRMDRDDAGSVMDKTSRRSTTVGAVLLAAGMVYLVAMNLLTHLIGDAAVFGMWAASAAVAVGLAIAGPRLVASAFTAAARVIRGGGSLVGVRLQAAGSASSLRLSSLLCVVVVLLLGILSFMSVLNGGSSANWRNLLARHSQVPVAVNDLGGALTLKDVTDIAPAAGAIQTQQLPLGEPDPANEEENEDLLVVFGDCGALRTLAGTAPRGCTGSAQWIAVAGHTGVNQPHPTGNFTLGDGITTITLPRSSTVTVGRALPDTLQGALLLPARLAPQPYTTSSDFLLLATNTTLKTTLARLSAQAPAVHFDLGPLDRADPDTRHFPAQLQWLVIGACLALAIGVLALAAVILAEVRERSSQLRGLRILGAPTRHLAWAHLWSTAVPVLLLGWTATVTGWLVSRAMHAFDDRAVVHLDAVGRIGIGVVIVGVGIAALTFPDARKAVTRSAGVRA